tara:strand:- start:322 stop:897 length:576 start_codon:yes stop_codon:yes gene_type:complete
VGTMLFGSFAARTPNDSTVTSDDYEISIGLNNCYFHINRQWERELGTNYLDDLVWIKVEGAGVYVKPEYMNKESKSIKYAKLDWRKSWKYITWGFTTRSVTDKLEYYETFASIGLRKCKTYWDKVDVEISFDGYLPPDEEGRSTLKTFEFEDKFKVSWKVSERVRLYNLGEVAKLKGSLYYKAKIGVEVTI